MFSGEKLPEIDAERTVLRWLEDRDAPDVYRIYSDPKVMRYWSSLPYTELAQAEQLIADTHRLFEARLERRRRERTGDARGLTRSQHERSTGPGVLPTWC